MLSVNLLSNLNAGMYGTRGRWVTMQRHARLGSDGTNARGDFIDTLSHTNRRALVHAPPTLPLHPSMRRVTRLLRGPRFKWPSLTKPPMWRR